MLNALGYRLFLFVINIVFPPLTVILLCGWDWDLVLNCILLFLAIFPSHIHAFYISCTYFHRRGKVRRGHYPGDTKTLIKSKNVINGGASDREVEELFDKGHGIDPRREAMKQPQERRPRDERHDYDRHRDGRTHREMYPQPRVPDAVLYGPEKQRNHPHPHNVYGQSHGKQQHQQQQHEAGHPYPGGTPQSAPPQGGYPQAGPLSGPLQGKYPQAGPPQSVYPQGAYPQAGPPQSGYSQGRQHQDAHTQSAYPQAGYHQDHLDRDGYGNGYPRSQVPYAYR